MHYKHHNSADTMKQTHKHMANFFTMAEIKASLRKASVLATQVTIALLIMKSRIAIYQDMQGIHSRMKLHTHCQPFCQFCSTLLCALRLLHTDLSTFHTVLNIHYHCNKIHLLWLLQGRINTDIGFCDLIWTKDSLHG